MAELAARTDLSVPTIKYYLREGLLHPGQAVGATRSSYDDSHVRRLRLIRALTDVAHLRLDTARAVLAEVDNAANWHDAVGSAHRRLVAPVEQPPSDDSLARVQALLDRNGWTLLPDNPLRENLARALDALSELGQLVDDELLDTYAAAMKSVARVEIRGIAQEDPETAAQHAVIGTLLLEPVLLSIRRIAQQNTARALMDGRAARTARG